MNQDNFLNEFFPETPLATEKLDQWGNAGLGSLYAKEEDYQPEADERSSQFYLNGLQPPKSVPLNGTTFDITNIL